MQPRAAYTFHNIDYYKFLWGQSLGHRHTLGSNSCGRCVCVCNACMRERENEWLINDCLHAEISNSNELIQLQSLKVHNSKLSVILWKYSFTRASHIFSTIFICIQRVTFIILTKQWESYEVKWNYSGSDSSCSNRLKE